MITPLVVSSGDRVELEVTSPAVPPAPGAVDRVTIDDLTTGTAVHYSRNGGGPTQAAIGVFVLGSFPYTDFNRITWYMVTVNGNPLGTLSPQGTNFARPSGAVLAYTSPLTSSGASFTNNWRKS